MLYAHPVSLHSWLVNPDEQEDGVLVPFPLPVPLCRHHAGVSQAASQLMKQLHHHLQVTLTSPSNG